MGTKNLTEDQIQMQLVAWARLHNTIGPYLIHIPNGGYRNPREGAKFKRMGVLRGVSDIFLAKPQNGLHGLWIELKRPGGKLTSDQYNWIKLMLAQGYEAKVCYGFDEAKDVILEYLKNKER